MKNILLSAVALVLLATSAQAEFKRVEMTVFGMD
jgi:opacity protein-like surface antigen